MHKPTILTAVSLLTATILGTASASAAEKFDTNAKRQLSRPDGKPADTNKPVKVFILLGQSNMVGMGDIGPETNKGTLTYLTKKEGRYPYLIDDQGKKVGGWDYKRLCPSALGTGTDWGDLLKPSEKIGLRWKLVTFLPDDAGFDKATAFVRAELDAGRPVVIDFKFTGSEYPGGAAGQTLAIAGYLAEENLYTLCNPAIATPGLQLITAADLKHFWRSDHYGELSNGVLSRPAIVIDPP